MKTYSYGINSHPNWRLGTLFLISRPWYLALIEWIGYMADARWMFYIKLPNWPKIQWRYVTNPLVQWVLAHPRNTIMEVELGYDRVKELFYSENPDLFDGIWGDDINGERDAEDDESYKAVPTNDSTNDSTLA